MGSRRQRSDVRTPKWFRAVPSLAVHDRSMPVGDARRSRGMTLSVGDDAEPLRVLVVSYHFPPGRSVGGLRWGALTKYLMRRGCCCHVVTGSPGADAEAPEGLGVTVVRRRRTLNDAYRSYTVKRQARSEPGASSPPTISATGHAHGVIGWVRGQLGAMIGFPDESRGWILRAGRRARRLVRQLRPDVVVTSGPPHAAHVVGMIATVGRSVPLVCDLRDPWVSGAALRTWPDHLVNRGGLAAWAIRLLERVVLSRAAGVIANTTGLAAALTGEYPDARIAWVSNGIDLERLPDPPPTLRGFGLAHVGTLYGGRDLGPVLQALRIFLDEVPEAAAECKLRMAGSMEPSHESRLRSQIAEYRLARHVEFLGMLSRWEALDLMNRSRLAVVLAQGQRLQVPAKLYEPIGMRVPTLVLAESESATAMEGARLGAIVCGDGDIRTISAVLGCLWRERGRERDRAQPLPVGYDLVAERMHKALVDFAGIQTFGVNGAAARSQRSSQGKVGEHA